MVPLAAMLGGYRMGFTKSLVTAWLASQAIMTAANAAEPARSHVTPAAQSDQRYSHQQAIKDRRAAVNPLDRVALAVDGAESSHGANLAMWRPDPSGPQGPKLVTGVAVYLKRVLHESGLCDGVEAAASTEPKGRARSATQPATSPADPLVSTACSPPDGVGG